jgi:hypothetical protein
MGYGLDIGFIDQIMHTIWSTSTYSATASFHTLQITATNIKSSPAFGVFNSRSLANASNSGDSSDSRTQVLPVQWISHNWTLSIPLSQSQSYVTTDSSVGPSVLE